MPDRALVYFADPMCSWCWGFSPTIDHLSEALGLPVQVVMGGLATGDGARPLDRGMAATIAHHWHQVEEASGQPFDHGALERRAGTGWRYDTQLACMAVIAARSQDAACALPFLARLQRAFYADAVDLTDPTVYADLAASGVPDPAALVAALADPALAHGARTEFARARELGVAGFPTLMVRDGDTWALVARGYTPAEPLLEGIQGWLAERDSAAAETSPSPAEDAAACDLDDPAC